MYCCYFFFFKQKTAYEMRISDWSSDVCSSDLNAASPGASCARGFWSIMICPWLVVQGSDHHSRRVPMPRTGQVPGDFQSDSERAPPVVDIRKADDPVEQGAKEEHLTAMDLIARPCAPEMEIQRFFADTTTGPSPARRLAADPPKNAHGPDH